MSEERSGSNWSKRPRNNDRKPRGNSQGKPRDRFSESGDQSKDRSQRKPYSKSSSQGHSRNFRRDGERKFDDRDPKQRSYNRRDDERPGEDRRRDGSKPGFDDRKSFGGRREDSRGWGPRSGVRHSSHGRKGSFDKRSDSPRDRGAHLGQNEPALPENLQLDQLDFGARAQLKGLSKENADIVAGHLIMASQFIDDNPKKAHEHALAASKRAGRIGVVRETLGITAYTIGDFALALREFRTHRRISGENTQLPLMVDSERGLGRFDQALELARQVDASELPVDVRVQLAIVLAGVRHDMGDDEGAIRELTIPELDRTKAFSYSPDLFYAYGVALANLDREEEAESWFSLAERAAEALDAAEPDSIIVMEIFDEEPTEETGEETN